MTPDRADFRLLEDNEHFRVQRIDLVGESKVSVVERGRDLIVVALGDGLSRLLGIDLILRSLSKERLGSSMAVSIQLFSTAAMKLRW